MSSEDEYHARLLGGDEQVVAHGEVLEQLERLERAGQAEVGPVVGREAR